MRVFFLILIFIHSQTLYSAEPATHKEHNIPRVKINQVEATQRIEDEFIPPAKRRKLNNTQSEEALSSLKLPLDKKLERADIRILIQNNSEKSRIIASNALLEAAKNEEEWVIAEIKRLVKSPHHVEHDFAVNFLASFINLLEPLYFPQQKKSTSGKHSAMPKTSNPGKK